MAKNIRWTEKEDQIIKNNYGTKEKFFILALLPNRSWTSINCRASHLHIYRLNYFTEDELSFIKDNCHIMTFVEMAKILNRNAGNIEQWARKFGIIYQENWTEKENSTLIEYFEKYDVDYISKNILKNRTNSSIYHQCQILGLSKKTKRYTKEELLSYLKELSISLGRTPLTSELVKYGLPAHGTYMKHFGSYLVACELLGLEQTATIFNQNKYYLSINGDRCYSRSEQIITNFLIENNIVYKMDKKYSTICKNGSPTKKRYDWLIGENIVVEYFGLNRNKRYQEKMKQKIELCELNNLKLIQIFEKDIFKLKNIFKEFIKS